MQSREVTITVDDILETLRVLAMPRADRLALTRTFVGNEKPAPWLDDNVAAVCLTIGLTRKVATTAAASHSGDAISIDAKGNVYRTELTDAGREALRTGVVPGAITLPSPS